MPAPINKSDMQDARERAIALHRSISNRMVNAGISQEKVVMSVTKEKRYIRGSRHYNSW